jgi:hypothetical protein
MILYHCQDFYQTWLYIWVWVCFQKQELLTFREYMSSPPFFVGSVLLIFLFF